MASSGLQRRRAGAGNGTNGLSIGVNGSYDDEDRLQSGASSPVQSASTSNGNASTPLRRNGNTGMSPSLNSGTEVRGGGGSITVTSERGHRIAYDPRDLQDEVETADHPRLTLMEECLLLGLKDKQVGSLSRFVSQIILIFLSYLARATSLFGTTTYHIPFEAAS
jgi:Golgi phosphoprotein 3